MIDFGPNPTGRPPTEAEKARIRQVLGLPADLAIENEVLSGTNTGDQTTITGNAGTATRLETARTINGVAFDGTANITVNAVDATPRVASSLVGAANGVASLDGSGKVPSTQLPSYVDDVVEYANFTAFPVSGETGKIYVARDTNKVYRWSGSAYIQITSGAVDAVAGKVGLVTLVSADITDATSGGSGVADENKLAKYAGGGSLLATTFKAQPNTSSLQTVSTRGDGVLFEASDGEGGSSTLLLKNRATLPDSYEVNIPLGSGTMALTQSSSGVPDQVAPQATMTAPADANTLVVRDTTTKSLSFSNLWTWIKSKLDTTLTIAGTKTWSGQQEATNQAATNATSLMTRGLTDARYVGDTTSTIVARPGDNLVTKYTAAKALTPQGAAKSAINRATLLICPGTYALAATLTLDADYVDVVGLGATESTPSVKLTGFALTVSSTVKNVVVSGIEAATLNVGEVPDNLIATSNYSNVGGDTYVATFPKEFTVVNGQVVELRSFEGGVPNSYTPSPFSPGFYVVTNVTPSTFQLVGMQLVVPSYAVGELVPVANARFRTDARKFVDCASPGDFAFGTDSAGCTATLINCVGGAYAFGGGTWGSGSYSSGTFINCVGKDHSFGGNGEASGYYKDCRGGHNSFGGSYHASGHFEDCVGGNAAFGGMADQEFYGASGTFIRCVGGARSFGYGGSAAVASGKFTDCVGGDQSFGGYYVTGTFVRCKAGSGSFGKTFGNATGQFYDCEAGDGSFCSDGVASGTFINCRAGSSSFGSASGPASGLFINCIAGDYSFGGSYGTASGTFIDCVAGEGAFGGMFASGVFIRCHGNAHCFGSQFSATGFFDGCVAAGASFAGDGGTAIGEFYNCRAGANSFGGVIGTASGTFKNCVAWSSSFARNGMASGHFSDCKSLAYSFGTDGTASGTFINCVSGDYSFGMYGTASGTFIGCRGGAQAFGGEGAASGIFSDCVGGILSFGGGTGVTGTFTNCTGGNASFGSLPDSLRGYLYNCRLTSGTFQNVHALEAIISAVVGIAFSITSTDHGLSVGDAVRFSTTGELPAGITAGTTYFVHSVTNSNVFKITASPGGAALNATSTAQSGVHTVKRGRIIQSIDGYNNVISQ